MSHHLSRRSVLLTATAALAVAACGDDQPSAGVDTTTSGAAAGGATTAPKASSSLPVQQLAVGAPATSSRPGVQATVTVSAPQVIDPPRNWGSRKLLAVTVAYDVTQGELVYRDAAFVLTSGTGVRSTALGVAPDAGLPGVVLGQGSLTGPAKQQGMVVFEAPAATTGHRVELVAAEQGLAAAWAL